MFKILFSILILALIINVFLTFILFVVDVIRWHDREESVKIIPSAAAPESKSESESEGAEEVSSDVGSNEHYTSTFSVPWGQS